MRTRRFTVLVALAIFAALAAAPGAAVADGSTPWRIMPSPNLGAGHNHLQEVSCVSNARCVAVGFNENVTTGFRQSVAATLSGGTWRLSPVPARGTSTNNLWNVSCVSATRCVAVGFYANVATGFSKTLIATFDGATWTLAATPNRPNVDNYLFGVDCTDATHCVAVGRSFDTQTSSSRSLVLTLTGTKWSITAVPSRAGVSNLLADVSCADASHCVAVGYTVAADNSIQTLILSRTGDAWGLDTSADRAASSNLLRDVSCPSATTCVAVGASDPGPGALDEQSLIETLSGGVWTVTTSPDRAGFDNHLWAVSCSNTVNCVAAGQSQNDTLGRPLIQTLANGIWTLTSPTPYRPATFNHLYGLSCFTIRNCKAVGDYVNKTTNIFRTAVLTNSP
jgi:hypothetical protein